MTPVPPRAEEPTVKVEEADSDLAQYEREGWSVGFDVEFHGTAIEVVAVNDSDSSFSSDDDDDDNNHKDCNSNDDSSESDNEDAYAGYQRVPVTACAEQEEEFDEGEEGKKNEEEEGGIEDKTIDAQLEKINHIPGYVPTKVKLEFDKLMMTPCTYEHDEQVYIPNDIPLDEEKTNQIKKAMAGFTLQPNESFNTEDLLGVVQKITQK